MKKYYQILLLCINLLLIMSLFFYENKFIFITLAFSFLSLAIFFYINKFKGDFYLYGILTIIFIWSSNDSKFLPIIMDSSIYFALTLIISFIYFVKLKFNNEEFYLGNKIFIYFLLILFAASLYGWGCGYPFKTIVQVSTKYIVFFTYYIFFDMLYKIYFKRSERYNLFLKITYFLFFVCIGQTILYHVMDYYKDYYGGFTKRVVAQQYGMWLFVIPFVYAFILFYENRKYKIIYSILLAIMIYDTFFEQVRSIMMINIFQMGIITFYYIFSKVSDIKILLKRLAMILIFLIIMGSGLALKLATDKSGLLYRIKTMSPKSYKQDFALFHRVVSIKAILGKINEKEYGWIIGTGIANEIKYPVLGTYYRGLEWIDNSYLVIIFHMGLIGLVTFMWILWIYFKKSIFILKNSNIMLEKIFAISLLSFQIGLPIVGVVSAIFVKYKYNILYSFVWALCDIICIKIMKNKGIIDEK